MNEKEQYESLYEDTTVVLIVLTKRDSGIAYEKTENRIAYTYLYAYLNTDDRQLIEKETRLEWLVPISCPEEEHIFEFKSDTCYKIRARRKKPSDTNAVKEWFEVLEILESDVRDSIMQEVLENMKKPVVVHDNAGDFTLNRDLNWFEGKIDWLGNPCSVNIEPDEDNNLSIEPALIILNKIIENIEKFDDKIRNFAADELLEGANEYAADDDEPPVTHEEFRKRMKIEAINFESDGSAGIYFEDDDMFWGHTIVIYTDEHGEPNEADIAG